MAAGKEIRGKIKSVENTKKITKAMEMVAASKMRKAQERMRQARPYAERVRALAANLSHATPEYRHPFLVANDDEAAVLVKEMAALPATQRVPVLSHWGVTGGKFFLEAGQALQHVDFSVIQTFSFFRARPAAPTRS